MTLEADYAACRDLVRAEDRDRYLAALFAPADRRQHVFSLYAFNVEIARVAEQVREPMMGEIRLQWWHDAIDGIAPGDAAGNPVANALLDTIGRFDLPKMLLHELLDARAFDFQGGPMETLARLENYLDATSTNPMRLAATIAGGDAAEPYFAHAGRAWGITGLLRSFGPHAARGRILAPPLEILERHGARIDDALSGEATANLRAALREMRDLARFHAAEMRRLANPMPGSALAALLPAALVPAYLGKMESADYDPFRTRIEIAPWKKPWLLWRAARRAK